jgi:salicylate hydroxylase
MDISPTLIIGGGIAGLATALALGDRDSLILEQAAAFSPIGAGLQLGPNAVRALQKLGAWDAVEIITSSPAEIHFRDGVSGKILHRLPLGKIFEKRFGAPYRVAHRADLHKALLSVVKATGRTVIQLGETVTAIDNHLSGVAVECNGKSISSTSVIGTDGVNSNIRQQLFQGSAAKESGSIFHRAMLPVPTVGSIDFNCVNVWLYPSGHVVHYRVGKAQHLNLVAITPKDILPSRHFTAACADLRTLLQTEFTQWPGLYVQPLSSWSKGNIMLMGDAAHATLPYLAQGAAMALEDAACLTRVLPTTQSLKHAFAETAAHRRSRTKRLHDASLAAGRIYHLNGMLRMARNLTLQSMPASMIQSRMSWIYKG